jgi:hypothetical protein
MLIKELLIDFILNKLSSVISIGKPGGVIRICHLSSADYICNSSYPANTPLIVLCLVMLLGDET